MEEIREQAVRRKERIRRIRMRIKKYQGYVLPVEYLRNGKRYLSYVFTIGYVKNHAINDVSVVIIVPEILKSL